MALFIGDYTKGSKVITELEKTIGHEDEGKLNVVIEREDDESRLIFTLAHLHSKTVIDNIAASWRKSTGASTKSDWASFWYYERGHQVVIMPTEQKTYDIPLNIQSIANDTLTGDESSFRYVKDAVVIVTDHENPVEFTIDPRNSAGTITMNVDDVYTVYIILIKYNNWSKLQHPAHLAIKDATGERAVVSYILGTATVELKKRKFTMNALLKDEFPEKELEQLEETIAKEQERKNRIKKRQEDAEKRMSSKKSASNNSKNERRDSAKRPRRKK